MRPIKKKTLSKKLLKEYKRGLPRVDHLETLAKKSFIQDARCKKLTRQITSFGKIMSHLAIEKYVITVRQQNKILSILKTLQNRYRHEINREAIFIDTTKHMQDKSATRIHDLKTSFSAIELAIDLMKRQNTIADEFYQNTLKFKMPEIIGMGPRIN